MAFGPIMQLKVGELEIELAPLTKESMGAFVSPGMQQAEVTRYLGLAVAPTLEDEQEWYDKTRQEKDSLVWGIWVKNDDDKKIIGTSGVHSITKGHTQQAVSGSLIFDTSYWGQGIASAIHKARTWYAFQHLGLTRIKSAVLHGNVASCKALEKTGYSFVFVERNEKFVDGSLRHMDNLECLNPDAAAWRLWWGTDRPSKVARDARKRTREAMEWAEQNVKLL